MLEQDFHLSLEKWLAESRTDDANHLADPGYAITAEGIRHTVDAWLQYLRDQEAAPGADRSGGAD